MQRVEEDSVEKAGSVRSGMRALNEDWTQALKTRQATPGVQGGSQPPWNSLGLLRVSLNNFSWGGSHRVYFPNNFSF